MRLINYYNRPVPAFEHGEFKENDHITAVLTEDDNRKKAVYIGIIRELKQQDGFPTNSQLNTLCFNGLKVNYQTALTYFPTLRESDYRA